MPTTIRQQLLATIGGGIEVGVLESLLLLADEVQGIKDGGVVGGGSQILFLDHAPLNSEGDDGDMAIVENDPNLPVYQKIAGAWVSEGNLKGPPGQDGVDGQDGAPGAPGAPGSQIHYTNGVPGAGLGIDGDTAIDTASTDRNVYKKIAGVWTLQTTLRGPAGAGTGDMLVASYGGSDGNTVAQADTIKGAATAGGRKYFGTDDTASVGFWPLPFGDGANYFTLADYHMIADGAVHTVADQIGAGKPFANLAAFQARYPLAAATTDDLNSVVLQQAFNELAASNRRTLFVPRGSGAYVFGPAPASMTAGPKLSNVNDLHLLFEKGAVFAKHSTHDSAADFILTFDRCHDFLCTNVMVTGKHQATPAGTANGNDHGINFHSCDRGRFVGGGGWYFGGSSLTIRTKQNTSPEPSEPDWAGFTVEGAHFRHNETGITTTQGGAKLLRVINCRFEDPILGHLKVSTRIQNCGRIEVAHCDFLGPGFQNTVEIQNHSEVLIHDCSFWDVTSGGAIIVQSNPDAGGTPGPFQEFTEDWKNVRIAGNRFQNCLKPIEIRNNGQDAGTRFVVRNVEILDNWIADVPSGTQHIIRVWDGPFAEVVIKGNYIGQLPAGVTCKPCEVNIWLSTAHLNGQHIVVFADNTIVNTDQPFLTLTRDAANSDRNWDKVWIQGNRGTTANASTYVYPVANITSLFLDAAGGGSGDMSKAVYDSNADNIVDAAATIAGLDAAGASKYVGTDAAGNPGFHALPTVANTRFYTVPVSDEDTPITAGAGKMTWRAPHAMTLTGLRASLKTPSSSGVVTVDVNENGVSILSTKLTIDANEKTSVSAATPVVISDTALADDAELTIDIDTAGTGASGLKVTFIGTPL